MNILKNILMDASIVIILWIMGFPIYDDKTIYNTKNMILWMSIIILIEIVVYKIRKKEDK